MNKRLYLFHDFETGGYENTSILSYYARITDENFNKLSELSLFFRPDDKIYKVEIQALEYNHIDLVAHDKKAKSFTECKNEIEHWLWLWTDSGMNKLWIGGHNVHWDNAQLESIIGKEMVRKRFHRHLLDTGSLALTLQLKEKLPMNFEISLNNLSEYFGVKPRVRHEAEADVETTIDVLKEMIKAL